MTKKTLTQKTFLAALPAFLSAPLSASAANFNNIDVAISQTGVWVGRVIPMLITLATVYFFWETALFVMSAANEEKREGGKKGMVWGVVAVFVIVVFWGLVGFLTRTFNVGQTPVGAVAPGVQNLPP
jgi:hypothetical protein